MPGDGPNGVADAAGLWPADASHRYKDLLTFSPLPGGPDITVKVGADTRLTKENKPAHLTDIKAGDYVRVMFLGEGTVTVQIVTLLDEKNIPAK